MKKLSLKVDDLSVESFEVGEEKPDAGTVQAFARTATCDVQVGTCFQATCFQTCDGVTCNKTCETCESLVIVTGTCFGHYTCYLTCPLPA